MAYIWTVRLPETITGAVEECVRCMEKPNNNKSPSRGSAKNTPAIILFTLDRKMKKSQTFVK